MEIIQTNSNYFNSIQSDSLNDDDSETEHKKHHSAGLIIAVIILCIALLLGLVCIVLYMLNITDILQLPKSNLFIEITDNVSEITAETDSVKETGKEIQPSSMVVEVLIDNTDIKGSFEFSYDDDKLIMVSLVNDDDSVQTVNIEYDERGNRITDYSWVVVGSDLSFEKISLVTVYKYYDENNYLIKSKELGGGYQIYKNDSKGNPIHVDDYDDAFIDAPRIKYTDDSEYDELNRCTSTRRHNISDDTTRDFTYYYSESNTEPDYYTEEYDKGSSDQRTYKTIFSYEYNDDGLLTKKIEESYDPDGNVSLKFSFKYNYDLSTS